jgi:anti-anti-sigma factor
MVDFSLVSEDRSGVTILTVSGRLDSETFIYAKDKIGTLIGSGKYRFIMDLSDVDFISSAGWGVIVGFLNTARQNHGDIKVCAMKEHILEVFRIMELDNIINSYRNVNEAVALF